MMNLYNRENELILTPLQGEVIAGYPPDHKFNLNKQRWEYDVKCTLLSGKTLIVNNVIVSEMTGSILNTFQRTLETTGDLTLNGYNQIVDGDVKNYTLGERVIVQFIGGNPKSPVITGFLPHPLSVSKITRPLEYPYKAVSDDLENQEDLPKDKILPALDMNFNGMNLKIDERGSMELYHFGTTKVEQKEGPFSNIVFSQAKSAGDNQCRLKITDQGSLEFLTSTGSGLNITNNNRLRGINLFTPTTSFFMGDSLSGVPSLDSGTGKIVPEDSTETHKGIAGITAEDKIYLVTPGDTAIISGESKLVFNDNKMAIGTKHGEVLQLISTILKTFTDNQQAIAFSRVGECILSPKVVAELIKLTQTFEKMRCPITSGGR